MFTVDLKVIPQQVKDLSAKWIKVLQTLEDDLNKGIVKDAADYIPEGEADRLVLIAILATAVKGLEALKAIADNAGFKARLLRLSADLTAIQHDSSKHTIGWYIAAAQMIFNDIFG